MFGKKVRIFVHSELEAGNYTAQWNGENSVGQTVASGVYIYRVVAGEYVKSLKMMFLK
jgi:flagellar hook assembly protein FlgD